MMEALLPRRLTMKRQKWVARYVETGDANQATIDTYDTSTAQSRYGITKTLMNDAQVQLAVQEALKEHGIDPGYIIGKHKDLVEDSENDMVKTKNLEDLGQLAGMYPKKSASKVDVTPEGITVQWGAEE